MRYTREFHIADVKGLQSHFKIPEFSHDATKISRLADALIADYSQKYGIEIVTRDGGDKAYSQGKTVVLPAKEQFPVNISIILQYFMNLHTAQDTLSRNGRDWLMQKKNW